MVLGEWTITEFSVQRIAVWGLEKSLEIILAQPCGFKMNAVRLLLCATACVSSLGFVIVPTLLFSYQNAK